MSKILCTFAPAKVFSTDTVAYRRKTEGRIGNLAFAIFADSFKLRHFDTLFREYCRLLTLCVGLLYIG